MKYRIWAEVSGGVTGSRQTWLKSGHRAVGQPETEQIAEFDTLEEAQAKATQMNREMNSHTAGARFRYTVKEIE